MEEKRKEIEGKENKLQLKEEELKLKERESELEEKEKELKEKEEKLKEKANELKKPQWKPNGWLPSSNLWPGRLTVWPTTYFRNVKVKKKKKCRTLK